MKKTLALLMALCLLVPAVCARAEAPFIRVDRDDMDAWKGELDNVRFLEEEGMSGSAQFSVSQFRALAALLRERSGNVWIIDCRQETHGFINGIAVSWCGENNGANRGKTADMIEEEEAGLSALIGTDVTVHTARDDLPADAGRTLTVETWQTERGLALEEDFGYLRLSCPDHGWPPAEVIDAFIEFASSLDSGAWLHFHCQAGSGRTGAFMTIYEMMRKPDAPAEDILRHQAETGSGNLVDRAAPEKSFSQKERCVLARAVSAYIRENHQTGYALKWSEWLDAHTRTVTLAAGERLDGEGFSSDPLVVSDSLEAVGPGDAAVLAGDTVVYIHVEER